MTRETSDGLDFFLAASSTPARSTNWAAASFPISIVLGFRRLRMLAFAGVPGKSTRADRIRNVGESEKQLRGAGDISPQHPANQVQLAAQPRWLTNFATM